MPPVRMIAVPNGAQLGHLVTYLNQVTSEADEGTERPRVLRCWRSPTMLATRRPRVCIS